MECEFCQALLVEVFASSESEDDAKTDPIQVIGGGADRSTDTDALLRAAHEIDEEDAAVEDEAPLQRLPRPLDFTGDLPRLFRFSDRYQILEKVGEGGMGRVYKALDLELDRPVALKTIRTEKGTSREVLERFKQELILARKITHKNVIRIYDLGESDGMKFFTMELVEGENLREALDKRKKIPVKECLSLMAQILNGLGEAHRQGVVHRDLKPQNIMVDREGVVRIMDFGIARTADSATMTGTGEMMGTPDYISPEQVKGDTCRREIRPLCLRCDSLRASDRRDPVQRRHAGLQDRRAPSSQTTFAAREKPRGSGISRTHRPQVPRSRPRGFVTRTQRKSYRI